MPIGVNRAQSAANGQQFGQHAARLITAQRRRIVSSIPAPTQTVLSRLPSSEEFGYGRPLDTCNAFPG